MSNSEYIINNHLKELHPSEFEIVKDEPDIRNWKVIGLHNLEIGIVNDLLFDEATFRVKYLIVDIYGKQLNIVSRLVLIPMGLVELLPDENLVVVSGLTVGHLASLPSYEKGKITSVFEHSVKTVFANSNGVIYQDDDLEPTHHHEHADHERFYRPRTAVIEKASLKEEMKNNLEQVKETVKKMEKDLEKLDNPIH